MPEYYTVQFPNDSEGVRAKNAVTAEWAALGWRIASEVVEQGHIKGGQACCGASICLPLAFLAGRTPGIINVTFVRDNAGYRPEFSAAPRAFGGSEQRCATCGQPLSSGLRFCGQCGTAVPANVTLLPSEVPRKMGGNPADARGQQEASEGNALAVLVAVIIVIVFIYKSC